MNHAFVLPCYFNQSAPVIFKAVETIRQYHPDSKIIVVDSGSADKSYFNTLEKYEVIIEDINNNNYDTGAYWHVYQKYHDIDYFYFLHDSIEINDNLYDLMDNKITSVRYFHSGDFVGGRYVVEDRSFFVKEYLLSKISSYQRLYDIYGFNDTYQQTWCHSQLQKTKYFIPKYFLALFGPMMCVQRSVMEILYTNNLHQILPTNKSEQMAMERIFGIVLAQEGLDISLSTLQGDHQKGTLDTSRINKIILNRQ